MHADVVDAVGLSPGSAIGLVALTDRADLPWWRGLSDDRSPCEGAVCRSSCSRKGPADLPALVLSRADNLVDNTDVTVYDARWSDVLPGKLMDQGIEVLSFFRSGSGVDALLAISGRTDGRRCAGRLRAAGARPDVLRHCRWVRRPDRRGTATGRRRIRPMRRAAGMNGKKTMTEAGVTRDRRPQPKAGVLDIAAYVPGKSKGTHGKTLHKLSSNETPAWVPARRREAAIETVAQQP